MVVTDEIIKELFKSLFQRYQESLKEKMRDSDFAFDGVNFLYYDFNKISIIRGGSYIDSPKWLKNKKSTINPKNNDYKCFQYAITLALNLEKYITFSVPIKKKIENKDIEITYKIKFIDSFRFMATSLPTLVDNLTEDIHGDKCVDYKSDLSYMKVMDETLIFRCFNCKKTMKKKLTKN